jgi:hypothetical protein
MTGDALIPRTTWTQYVTQIYMTGNRPVIGSYDYRVIEAKAREAMKDNLRACPHGAQLHQWRINLIIVASCVFVYVRQCWNRQHVSQQLLGTGAMANRPAYATQRHPS